MSPASPAPRTGILGGTFDPIHQGHLDTAQAARDALGLDRVMVMPARVPPHRQQGPSASTFHRFAMAALAIGAIDAFIVSDGELSADGPSYTALTLERMARSGMAGPQLFFITGADAFAEIETWYRYPTVLDLANFVVVSRPGTPVASMPDRLPELRDRMRTTFEPGNDTAVFLVDARTADVSSSEIRRRLRSGERITGLVPAPVEAHIHRHRLYVATPTADHAK
jgi:nicotinate-nucleotide adenylyltransferase